MVLDRRDAMPARNSAPEANRAGTDIEPGRRSGGPDQKEDRELRGVGLQGLDGPALQESSLRDTNFWSLPEKGGGTDRPYHRLTAPMQEHKINDPLASLSLVGTWSGARAAG